MKIMDEFKYVGKSYSVNDAIDKVTGELRYVSDYSTKDALCMKLLVSDLPHAEIIAIDTAEALKISGVKAIFHHWNTPKKRYNTYRALPDYTNVIEDRYLYADKARYAGDVVASVVAEDEECAEAALRKIKVEYKELPPLVSLDDTIKNRDVKIHESGNVITSIDFTAEDANIRPRSGETKQVKFACSTQKISHLTMETHAYMADYRCGELTIWTSTQGIFGVRTIVADMFDIPYNKVRIIKLPMGGSFGGKQEFIYEPHVAYAAMTLKKAVKLHLDRKETLISTTCRTAADVEFDGHFLPDGAILDCNINCLVDAGAYAGNSLHMLGAMKGKVTRGYHFQHYTFRGKALYTNTPVAGGMRGWGSPEMFTVFEIYLGRVARELKLDPVALRMSNIMESGAIDISSKMSTGNACGKECLEIGAREFNWEERRRSVHNRLGRHRRGVGMAYGAQNNGEFKRPPDISTMTIRMNEDGSIILQTSLHEVGCGTLRSMQIIAAEVLDVNPDDVAVTEGDTKYTPYDLGSYGSRVTYVSGECTRKIANGFLAILKAEAAEYWNLDKREILPRAASMTSKDGRLSITYRELATKLLIEKGRELILTQTYKSISNPSSCLANFAEVEVDTLTGFVRIKDFLSVNDIGQAINRQMVINQIKGGLQMAAGYALCEDLGIGSSGRAKNDSLSRYHSLNCVDMPDFKVILLENGKDDGPFGAKGVGEASTVAGTAAIVNAVCDALDVSFSKLPLSPERIVAALENVE